MEDAISTLTDVGVHIDRIETHINEAVNEIRTTAKIVESIPNRLSAALSRELSQADKSIEKKHSASMQVLENNSNTLKEISQSIDDDHRNISKLLNSLTRWGVIFAALTLLGVWISAIILLIRG